MPNSPSRKETNKTGLIQARGDDDAHARAERELLEFKEFAGSQMIALDAELTDDANTNALHWWKKWGSKFPDLSQCPRGHANGQCACRKTFPGGGSGGYSEEKLNRNRLDPSTISLLVFLHEALPISRTGLEADTMLKPLDQEQENDLDDVMCDYGLVRYDSYNT